MTGKRTTEAEISEAVLRILNETPNGEASTDHLKRRLPDFVKLTDGDRAQSDTRQNEELWEQIVRNIVSHKKAEGNIVAEGLANSPSRGKLRITDAGRLHVKNKYG
jgi:restriction endonuclease Mrr